MVIFSCRRGRRAGKYDEVSYRAHLFGCAFLRRARHGHFSVPSRSPYRKAPSSPLPLSQIGGTSRSPSSFRQAWRSLTCASCFITCSGSRANIPPQGGEPHTGKRRIPKRKATPCCRRGKMEICPKRKAPGMRKARRDRAHTSFYTAIKNPPRNRSGSAADFFQFSSNILTTSRTAKEGV